MRHSLLRIVTVFFLLFLDAAADIMVDSFDDTAGLSMNPDGGNSPEIRHEQNSREGSGVRLIYRNMPPKEWGNVRHAVSVPPEATGVRFWLKVNSAAPEAAMHVWLFEADRDGYLARVSPGGRELHELTGEWVEVSIPFAGFTFKPRGDKKRGFLSIDHMQFGCNFGDLDVSIDEFRLIRDEVSRKMLPRTPNLSIQHSEGGSIAVLDEPTFEQLPGHARPSRLKSLLEGGGFGVTLLRAGDLCDSGILRPGNFDVLVLPCAPFFPAEARDTFLRYLARGGSFVSIGGYAFDSMVEYSGEGWTAVNPAVRAADMDGRVVRATGINTRFGKPADTMRLDREQIGVFDPSYELRDVVSMRKAPGQEFLRGEWSREVSLEGFAAVAMTGSNSAVFPDVYARWIPIIDCADAFGRSRGAACALIHNYAGPYAKAGWAIFGVTNRDLFDGSFPALDRLLAEQVRRLVRSRFLHGLSTDLACYRQGESVKLSVNVESRRVHGESARVHFRIDDRLLGTRDAAPARDGSDITFTWAPGEFDRDFYRVSAVLEVDGVLFDEMETGFTVWNRSVVDSGPDIRLHSSCMEFRGKSTFLCGSNQTGMMWYSANENPLVWNRDLWKMSDSCLNILRVLHFSPFARDSLEKKGNWRATELRNRPLATRRKTDAIVQLAQKHNIAVFLTLHDWMPVALTADELDAQREWAEFWCSRYRDVPGILVDIQNEPRVTVPDRDDIRKIRSDWLAGRYGSVERAREVWQDTSGVSGESVSASAQDAWGDLRSRDLDLFRSVLFDRWTRANVEGARAGDPDMPVTVGHLQHLTAADKLLGAENLDFTSTHYYGSVGRFRRILKMIDRRFEGKVFTLGEFGSRVAHDARTHGRTGDTAEESVRYYLAVGHYALGMGAAFVANWDWKDFRDCVFPWGINHADLVSKPVLKAYRNMALLFRALQPRYVPPRVYLLVPDSHRFGARGKELHDAILRAVEYLFDCNVSFGVINEFALDRLPAEARALIWMLPYCPADSVFEQVRDFVSDGGAVMITGDVRFDSERRPNRLGRLRRLGLSCESDPVPPFEERHSDSSSAQVDHLQWGSTGNGRACWLQYPLELDPEASGGAVYSAFLRELGFQDLLVEPADGSVHAFELPARNGRALVVYNDSDQRRSVRVSGIDGGRFAGFELDPGRPGMLVWNSSGDVIAAESQGAVSFNGREIMRSEGHHAVLTLDRRELSESDALLVLPFGPGSLRVTRRGGSRDMVGEIGEFRAGIWHGLGSQPASGEEDFHVEIPESGQLDLRLFSTPGRLNEARAAISAMLSRMPRED